ncbi:MAG TPA: Asp23/Gls24 family envelope stress response protein [Planctomycetota bacterium]|nr:Asp23/Gls24 family envelope stress response protein [Planctomycetota bacterium]
MDMVPLNQQSQVVQDAGLLTVNRKVVKAVIHRVASDVPGVVQLGGDSIWKKLFKWLNLKPRPRGIELELADGEAAMTLTLVVRMGARVPEIAAEVRRRVKRALKEQLGIDVRTVNVNVTSVKVGQEIAPYEDVDPSAERDASRRRRFDFEDPPL